MTEKQYNVRAGYYYEYTGICRNKEENLTTNEVCDLLNELSESNYWLIQQNIKGNSKRIEMSIQIDELKNKNKKGDIMIPKGHERWIDRIREYDEMKDKDDKEVIIFALSYTLQSLRYNENMDRFKWQGDKL